MSQVEKVSNKKHWLIVVGSILCLVGFIIGYFWYNSYNYGLAILTVIFLFGGGLMVYYGFNTEGKSGYTFKGKKWTGKENTIIIAAKKGDNGKEVPLHIKFFESRKQWPSSYLHYVRNCNKHFYVIRNYPGSAKAGPVEIKDTAIASPRTFSLPAHMENFKRVMEFVPESLLHKLSPFIMLGAIGIVGLLIVITGPGPGG